MPRTAARWPKSFQSGPSLQTPSSSTLSSGRVYTHGYLAVSASCNSRKIVGGGPCSLIRLSSTSHAALSSAGRSTDGDVVAHGISNSACLFTSILVERKLARLPDHDARAVGWSPNFGEFGLQ